ncbi:DUF924 family protein [Pseudoalteromonas byunsanensis]|uniref:DUF924 domain-containing protein n=1 Tax=Pseudoalteromonas byunsanensis TaxID=327939 RepID=A0A1S1NE17_9GAMM|nr:DUF924 family protein [Pseudoalteromonas byunsanensis]OHU96603.1 hypothetical protein BIW53_04545 [Pseudoalteromonas byunsanensis]
MIEDVLAFWFEEIDPKMWWQKNAEFDSLIKKRFGALHAQASRSELYNWRTTAQGSLAEIIILDQFSRNIHRDNPLAFASDPLALALAQTAIAKGFDLKLPSQQRSFVYLPFMHSESPAIHIEAVKLYEALGNKQNLDFELKHQAIINMFGRYPHRNAILGRLSTKEEMDFLHQPDSSF